jgi:hypothetical protein
LRIVSVVGAIVDGVNTASPVWSPVSEYVPAGRLRLREENSTNSSPSNVVEPESTTALSSRSVKVPVGRRSVPSWSSLKVKERGKP